MRTIPLDDLVLGEWITVLEAGTGPNGRVRVELGTSEDISEAVQEALDCKAGSQIPPGAPLRIIGVNLPFVYCQVLTPDGELSCPQIIDVRKVRLIKLDEEVPQAIMYLAGVLEEEVPQDDVEDESPAACVMRPRKVKSAATGS